MHLKKRFLVEAREASSTVNDVNMSHGTKVILPLSLKQSFVNNRIFSFLKFSSDPQKDPDSLSHDTDLKHCLKVKMGWDGKLTFSVDDKTC